MPNDQLQKRSLRIAGHRTSLAIEPEFWVVLEELAKWKGKTMPVLLAEIDKQRAADNENASLASAVRVACLKFAMSAPKGVSDKIYHKITDASELN